MTEHLQLLIQYKDGRPRREPVHAVRLADGNYRVLNSPGFVEGIAAGDEIALLDEDGKFEVLKRGGNVAVQVYSSEPIEMHKRSLEEQVVKLKGVLDGAIEKGMVFTIPVAAGFPNIEKIFNSFVEANPKAQWVYGNVYDPEDGVTPLDWWKDEGDT